MKQVCFNMKLSVEREGLVLFCFLKVVAGQYLRYVISLLNQEQIWPSEYMKSSVSLHFLHSKAKAYILYLGRLTNHGSNPTATTTANNVRVTNEVLRNPGGEVSYARPQSALEPRAAVLQSWCQTLSSYGVLGKGKPKRACTPGSLRSP